jgi:hypothetical protein
MKPEVNARHERSTDPRRFRALGAFVPTCLRAFLFILLPSSFILSASGCQIAGAIAHAVPQTSRAKYTGLAGQSVGIMVWADRGVRIDWNYVRLDLANLVQDKLRNSKSSEVKGATYPVLPASIVRYQEDHPGIEAMPITEVAPKLGVSRLIYIEILALSTRSDTSFQMYRGRVQASMKIVEVSGGKAVTAYEESDLHATYPPKSTLDGVVGSSDVVMYKGVLAALADEVVNQVTTHEVE